MPFNEQLHLFAVMNDPCPNRLCLMCMVTSIKPNRVYDPACVLNAGDHPMVTRPSYILYRFATLINEMHIRKMLSSQFYRQHHDFPMVTFKRIVVGLYASQETPNGILKYAASIPIS